MIAFFVFIYLFVCLLSWTSIRQIFFICVLNSHIFHSSELVKNHVTLKIPNYHLRFLNKTKQMTNKQNNKHLNQLDIFCSVSMFSFIYFLLLLGYNVFFLSYFYTSFKKSNYIIIINNNILLICISMVIFFSYLPFVFISHLRKHCCKPFHRFQMI